MNGIVARIGLEQLILLVLALAAALAVLIDFGGAFWMVWLVLATVGLIAVKCHNYRFALGTRQV